MSGGKDVAAVTKPEVFLTKYGLPTVMNGISYHFSKSSLHVDSDQLKIPALWTLQLFLGPPRVLMVKSKMDEHRIGQIMKTVASCLPEERDKKLTNHSTRKTVVAKWKEAGQPLHKIIQVTGHARESSLDDYGKTAESEPRQLSRIKSVYAATSTLSVIVQRSIAGNYFSLGDWGGGGFLTQLVTWHY